MTKDKKIAIENVNVPGRITNIDARKYQAMRNILLKILPKRQPGLTQAEMGNAVQPHLPQDIWPNGKKSLWWVKTVQLDLEAKGLVGRNRDSKPTRWFRI